MAGLQAIFLDIDDTLYPTSEFTAMARRKAIQAMIAAGLKVSEDLAFRELSELVKEFTSNDTNHYDRLMLRLPPGSLDGVNPTIVVAAGVAAYHDHKFRALTPYPDVTEVMPQLARIPNVHLGALTSGIPSKQAEKLVRLKLFQLIKPDAFFVAENLGYSKINPKFYTTVARRMNLDPTRCLHVGDKLDADITSARQAGYQAIWINRNAKPSNSGLLSIAAPDHICCNFQELLFTLKKQYGLVPAEAKS
ncbi:MAG TPA: HAD-IA family hydrolase [Planctomycetota bacterium]|nr:HAD-IA family hydrolase [Planctomycetota bacterium]